MLFFTSILVLILSACGREQAQFPATHSFLEPDRKSTDILKKRPIVSKPPPVQKAPKALLEKEWEDHPEDVFEQLNSEGPADELFAEAISEGSQDSAFEAGYRISEPLSTQEGEGLERVDNFGTELDERLDFQEVRVTEGVFKPTDYSEYSKNLAELRTAFIDLETSSPQNFPKEPKTIAPNTQTQTSLASDANPIEEEPSTKTLAQNSKPDTAIPVDDRVWGKWIAEPSTQEWMDRNGAYPQFFLRPVDSTDSQDVIFSHHEDPEQDRFEFKVREFGKGLHLFAAIYKKASLRAVAQIPYEKVITRENYRGEIVFYLPEWEFEHTSTATASSAEETTVYLSMFEGGTGNYREPKQIAGGRVKVLGVPEFGELVADAQGVVKIKVPANSELIVEGSAPGYQNGFAVIPTFSSAFEYHRLYLISLEHIESVSHYFLRSPQSDSRGVLLGMLFETDSRKPQARGQIRLNSPRPFERPVFYGAFPDPSLRATTDLGKFGFYNVEGLRWLLRPEGKRTRVFRSRSSSADYLEFGRAGLQTVRGQIWDPVSKDMMADVPVQFFADSNSKTFSNSEGNFEIPGIDFSPGVIDLTAGQQLSFTLPFNSIQPQPITRLFYFDESVLAYNRGRFSRVRNEENVGSIIVGALSSIFSKSNDCLRVELIDSKGRRVDGNHGPYPFVISSESVPTEFCFSFQQRSFAFYNLPPDEYLVKITSAQGLRKMNVVHLLPQRTAVRVLR